MAPRWRLCPKCKYRYERVKRRCPACAAPSPKKRVPKHAETLRDHSYEHYVEVTKEIHGLTDESCCICRRPKSKERRHDRDHEHHRDSPAFGQPRGLLCTRCNRMLVREMTVEWLENATGYMKRVRTHYAKPKGPDCPSTPTSTTAKTESPESS